MLLDTHVLLALIREELHLLNRDLKSAVLMPPARLHASVASLWEIAIKYRIGKLRLKVSLDKLPELIGDLGLHLLRIEAAHVLANTDPVPPTGDPFDRLLLAQCAVENLRLVTTDRALAGHPLAWRAG